MLLVSGCRLSFVFFFARFDADATLLEMFIYASATLFTPHMERHCRCHIRAIRRHVYAILFTLVTCRHCAILRHCYSYARYAMRLMLLYFRQQINGRSR